MRTMSALLMGLLVGGCGTTPMDWNKAPPADWPALAERLIDVPADQIRGLCVGKGMNFRGVGPAGACTTANFTMRTCTIYTSSRDPRLLEHERGHCQGYDHPDESTARDAWAKYKARGGM